MCHNSFCFSSQNLKFVGLGGRFNPYNPDTIYDVISIVTHPKYNTMYSLVYNDIALLQVDRR